MLRRLVLASAVSLCFTGCASLVDGNSQPMSFASTPDEATVYINGQAVGKTPVTIPIKRKSGDQQLKFSKEGYKDVELTLISNINPWFFGNVVSGGLLGSTTDGLSGAAFKYDPSSYMVTLPALDAVSATVATSRDERQKIVGFIVAGYQGIILELNSNKEGQYLKSLFELSKGGEKSLSGQEGMKKLRALSEVYQNIPEFAERAADILE